MRTVMMREQDIIRAPKIVVAVQTDAYGVVMFSYPLECKFYGGPCIDDCKRLFLRAVGDGPLDDFGSILMCNASVYLNKDAFANPKPTELGYLYDPLTWWTRKRHAFLNPVWIQSIYPGPVGKLR